MPNFSEKLSNAVLAKNNPVLVGIDPRYESLPISLRSSGEKRSDAIAKAFEQFSFGVIDVVASLVPAIKPQAAFFEQYGPAGMSALKNVIDYAKKKGLLVIFDGKRNDIGSTAVAYADGILGNPENGWGADALTVSPYLGEDSISPFIEVAEQREAGVFVLVKTSNPGGAMLQDLASQGKTIYRHVADYVEFAAKRTAGPNGYGIIGAVVGATWPEQLAELRAAMPHAWFLVPGFGAQGGGAKDVMPAFDSRGLGAIINNSRGILYAYRSEPFVSRFGESRWQEAVEVATLEMIDQLKSRN